MDTPEEIARDKFIQSHWEMCGTCKYKKRYCENQMSEYYGDMVDDNDTCGEWRERKKWV